MKFVDGKNMCVGSGRVMSDGREEVVLESEADTSAGEMFRAEISGMVGSIDAVLDAEDRRVARGGIGGAGNEKLSNTIPTLDWLGHSSGLAGLGGGVFNDTGGFACGVAGGGRFELG